MGGKRNYLRFNKLRIIFCRWSNILAANQVGNVISLTVGVGGVSHRGYLVFALSKLLRNEFSICPRRN